MTIEKDGRDNGNAISSVLLVPDFSPIRGLLYKALRWSFYIFIGFGVVIAFFPLENSLGRPLCRSAVSIAGPLTQMVHFYDGETPRLGCRMILSLWIFIPSVFLCSAIILIVALIFINGRKYQLIDRRRYVYSLLFSFILLFSAFYIYPGSRYGGAGQLIFGSNIVLIFVSILWFVLLLLIIELTVLIVKCWRQRGGDG